MKKLHITDHALIRFLERAGGFDVEGLRAQLAASLQRSHDAATLMRAEKYRVTVGAHTFLVRGDRVITITTSAEQR